MQPLIASKPILNKVDEMRLQRAELIRRLRQSLHEDDVTSDLLTADQSDNVSLDTLFANRLKKHDSLLAIIRQNLAAQDNIESALIDTNASFAPKATELRSIRKKRADQLQLLFRAGEAFDGLLEKSRQGLKFYEQFASQLKEYINELAKLNSKLDDLERILISSMKAFHTIAPTGYTPSRPYSTPTNVPTLGDYMASMRMSSARPVVNYPSGTRWPPTTALASFPQAAGSQSTYRTPVQSQFPSTAYAPQSSQAVDMYTGQPLASFQPPQVGQNAFTSAAGHAVSMGYISENAGSFQAHPVRSIPNLRPAVPNQPVPTIYGPVYPTTSLPGSGNPPLTASRTPHAIPTTNQVSSTPTNAPNWSPPTHPPMMSANPPVPSHPGFFAPRHTEQLGRAVANVTGRQPMRQIPLSSYPLPFQQTQGFTPHFLPTSVSGYAVHSISQRQPSSDRSYLPITASANPALFFRPEFPDVTAGVQPSQPFFTASSPYAGGTVGFGAPTTIGGVHPMANPQQMQSYTTDHSVHNFDHAPQHPQSRPGFTDQRRPTLVPPSPSTVPIPPNCPQSNPSTFPTVDRNLAVCPVNPITEANTNNAVLIPTTLPVPMPSFELLQPQILTEADFDTQRREERLRASFGSQNSLSSDHFGSRSAAATSVSAGHLSGSAKSSTVSSSSSAPRSPTTPSVPVTSTSHPNQVTTVQLEPLSDPLVLNRFITATENILTWLENLHMTVPGPAQLPSKPCLTRLDVAWNQVVSLATDQSKVPVFKGKKPTHAAALCCPNKNRRQDFVPFDANRVVLESAKNDYINASHIDLMNTLGEWCPRYIVAQAPMPKTVVDFWSMILTQGCEVIVLLLPSKCMRSCSPFSTLSNIATQGEGAYGDLSDPNHVPAHLPTNKVGSRFMIPGSSIELHLQAFKECDSETVPNRMNSSVPLDSHQGGHWTERILTVSNHETQQTRSLVHLLYDQPIVQPTSNQLNVSDNSSTSNFCKFIQHVHMYYRQQRSLMKPIAVVCEYGAGLSGVFLTASIGLLHSEILGRLADVSDVAGRLCQQRRGCLYHSSHLIVAAQVIAHAAVETLARRDIVVGPRRHPVPSVVPSVPDKSTPKLKGHSEPYSDLVDTLFSNRNVNPTELMSVVDKMATGSGLTPPVPNDEPIQPSTSASDVIKPTASPDDDSSNANPVFVPPKFDEATFDHLIELSSLSPHSPRSKRFTREDFQSGGYKDFSDLLGPLSDSSRS